MGTRAALKAKEVFMQYSKKMCTRVTIFWMLYRLTNFVVLLIRPDIAGALADLCTGVDTVMIVNMGTYTANSSTEKIAIAYTKRKSAYEEEDDRKDGDCSDEDGEENDNEEDNG